VNWIQGMHMDKGALHRKLGVPEGKKIPLSKEKAAAGKGGKLAREARLAMTFRRMAQKRGK